MEFINNAENVFLKLNQHIEQRNLERQQFINDVARNVINEFWNVLASNDLSDIIDEQNSIKLFEIPIDQQCILNDVLNKFFEYYGIVDSEPFEIIKVVENNEEYTNRMLEVYIDIFVLKHLLKKHLKTN